MTSHAKKKILQIQSKNMNGFIKVEARKFTLNKCASSKIDFLCIQESHHTQEAIQRWNKDNLAYTLQHNPYIPEASGTEDTSTRAKRGVITYVNLKEGWRIEGQQIRIGNGYAVITQANKKISAIQAVHVICINCYSPTIDHPNAQTELFEAISEQINEIYDGSQILIWAGDFNCVENVRKDKKGGDLTPHRAGYSLTAICAKWSLQDSWRCLNPQTQEFTHHHTSRDRLGEVIQTRIDRIYTNAPLNPSAAKAEIGAFHPSDHKTTALCLFTNGLKMGPGLWKARTQTFTKSEIKKAIETALQTGIEALGIAETNLHPMIWITLKEDIAEICKEDERKVHKENREKTQQAQTQILELEARMLTDPHASITGGAKETLEGIRLAQLDQGRSMAIQSKAIWQALGDAPTKYMSMMRGMGFSTGMIDQIYNQEGILLNDFQQVQTEIHRHYTKLCASNDEADLSRVRKWRPIIYNQGEENESEEASETIINLTSGNIVKIIAGSKLKIGKAPGIDGLTAEFYKQFRDPISKILASVYTALQKGTDIPREFNKGCIRLIPKHGKDPLLLKNARPITLLNLDYKILEIILVQTIQAELKQFISEQQTGFMKGRYIGQNLKLIADVIQHAKAETTPGLIISVDQASAFDSVSIEFILEMMKHAKISPNAIQMFRQLYTGASSVIINHGHISDDIELAKGVKQGAPASGILFILAMEYLIQNTNRARGIKDVCMDGREHKLACYADDVTFFVQDYESLHEVDNILKDFAQASGLRINPDKTEAVGVGPWSLQDRQILHFHIFPHSIKILGINFNPANPNYALDHNLLPALEKIDAQLKKWNDFDLGIRGRVMTIKTFIWPLILHIATIFEIPQEALHTIDRKFRRYIWKYKAARVAYKTLKRDIQHGGLRAIDPVTAYRQLKVSWITRWIAEPEHPWNARAIAWLKDNHIELTAINCAVPYKRLRGTQAHKFEVEVLKWWMEEVKWSIEFVGGEDISEVRIHNHGWLLYGIPTDTAARLHEWNLQYVRDWWNEIMERWHTYEELEHTGINFLAYHSVKRAFPNWWSEGMAKPPQEKRLSLQGRPIKGGLAIMYRLKLTQNLKATINWMAWALITAEEWQAYAKRLAQLAPTTTIHNREFKILHAQTNCRWRLLQWTITSDDICQRCTEEAADNISHHFATCPMVEEIWEYMESTKLIPKLEGLQRIQLRIFGPSTKEIMEGKKYEDRHTTKVAWIAYWIRAYISNIRRLEIPTKIDNLRKHIKLQRMILARTYIIKAKERPILIERFQEVWKISPYRAAQWKAAETRDKRTQ